MDPGQSKFFSGFFAPNLAQNNPSALTHQICFQKKSLPWSPKLEIEWWTHLVPIPELINRLDVSLETW
jgi:hypothetical protein